MDLIYINVDPIEIAAYVLRDNHHSAICFKGKYRCNREITHNDWRKNNRSSDNDWREVPNK